MTVNPTLHFNENEEAQSEYEVPLNLAMRILAASIAGKKTIDFGADADYTIQVTDPPIETDEWFWSWLEFTDTGVVLTGGVDVLFPILDALGGGGPTRPRFIFENNTAETLTVRVDFSGSAGVAVLTGTTVKLRYTSSGLEIEADA